MVAILYGELVSFGSYDFTEFTSSLSEGPAQKQITDAFVLGSPFPVDVLSGGPAPYASTNFTFTAWFVAPDDPDETTQAPAVEIAWQAALASMTDTVATLTVKNKASGGTVAARARLVDATMQESTREYSSYQAKLVFKLYEAFS